MSAAVKLLLVGVLLGHCKGENLSQRSPNKMVVATTKQTVTLPCFASEYSGVPNVEWSQTEPSHSIIFFYMNEREYLDMKNETFEGRTNIIQKELKKGNFSLRISNVQFTDAGTYQCKTKQKKQVEVLSVVKLIVVSDPVLSVVPAEDDQVSLQCQVDYCSTEPDIKILDHEENPIKAESPIKDTDSRGCVTSRIRVVLQSPTKSVTCRAHYSEIETKQTTLNIPAGCMKSCTATTVIGLLGGVLVGIVVTFMGLKIWNSWKKCCTETSKALPQSGVKDNDENNAIEQQKAGATLPAQRENAKRDPVVSQRGQSPSDDTQLKSTKPTGPLHNSNLNVCKTPQNNLRQVTKAKGSRPKSNTYPPIASNSSQAAWSMNKPNGQHQNTPALPMSRSPHRYQNFNLLNNPFQPLADLTEEREKLLQNGSGAYSVK